MDILDRVDRNALRDKLLAQYKDKNLVTDIFGALGVPKRSVDVAANYYSGLPRALDPSQEPIPLEDLAAEAVAPDVNASSSLPAQMGKEWVGQMASGLSDPTSYYVGGGGRLPMSGVINAKGENIVFHGSPYKIEGEGLNLSRLSQGEGTQILGRGAYVVDNPQVATSYRQKASRSHAEWDPNKVPGGSVSAYKIPSPDKFIDGNSRIDELPHQIKDWIPKAEEIGRKEDTYTKIMHDYEASVPHLNRMDMEAVQAGKNQKLAQAEALRRGNARKKAIDTFHNEPTTESPYTDDYKIVQEDFKYLGDKEAQLKSLGANYRNVVNLPDSNEVIAPGMEVLSWLDLHNPEMTKKLSNIGIAGVKDSGMYALFDPHKDSKLLGSLDYPNTSRVPGKGWIWNTGGRELGPTHPNLDNFARSMIGPLAKGKKLNFDKLNW